MDEQYIGETTSSSSVGLTLGGILSIKQTPPYRIHARTLLDLIRDDQSYGKESKKPWKMFRDKIRLKLYGSVSTTAEPVIASHAHVSTVPLAQASTEPRVQVSADPRAQVSADPRAQVSTSPHAHVSTPTHAQFSTDHLAHGSRDANAHVSTNYHALVSTPTHAQVSTDHLAHVSRDAHAHVSTSGGEEGGRVAVRMSLMSLLEVEASAYMNYDGVEEEEEEEEVTVEEGGYNNCCVCMVRHKGAAFIPCGHTFCRLCSRELFVKRASCPLCNNLILEILDIF